ncbi:cytochrome b5 heme-binding domain-containing protein, partial [Haematococcus lacustris]
MGDATALELTPAELSFYDGAARSQVYIAVQGTIYDVTSGASFYGPGGPYECFGGKECARALALMKIDVAECTSDLTGLTPKNLSTLQDWVRKFAAKYPVVGQLRKQ